MKENAAGEERSEPRWLVGLSIFGDLDFDRLANILGTPTDWHKKGQKHALGTFDEDRFGITSPLSRTSSVNEHLKWLNKRLQPHLNELRMLQKVHKVQIYCGVNFFTDQNGITIDPDCLLVYRELNHPIEITVLCLG